MRKTTLVLGAGASHFLGYPVGAALRTQILELTRPSRVDFSISRGLMAHEGELHAFINAFKQSQLHSIDSFLGRRAEYSSIGKRAIAALILEAEVNHGLSSIEHDDHWYRYLVNVLCQTSTDAWLQANLSIVTFNYDRSLEAYLHLAAQAIFNVDSETARSMVASIPIVHAYGWLGSPIEGENDFIPYASGGATDVVERASANILVIPEGRDDSKILLRARDLLAEADRIAFLGFGFDETNLRRLDSSSTCADSIQRPHGSIVREVYATCKGLTSAEAERAHLLVGQSAFSRKGPRGIPKNFWDTGCLQMLRETNILVEP